MSEAPDDKLPDDHDMPDEVDDGEEYDDGDDCGRWINGRLGPSCMLAGTEFCDWECPFSGEDA